MLGFVLGPPGYRNPNMYTQIIPLRQHNGTHQTSKWTKSCHVHPKLVPIIYNLDRPCSQTTKV